MTLLAAALGWGLFLVYNWWKKFQQYSVIVFEKDSFGKVHAQHDKAGVFVDKVTNYKLLFLQKRKIGLSCDDIPFVPMEKGRRCIFLVKTGEKNYRFVHVNFSLDKINFMVGEEDFNWAENAWERVKKTFGNKNFLEKYGPYILFSITIVIIMIIFIYFFKNFEVLKEVAVAFQKAAENLPRTYNGSMILS
jgi:hypothetical protein